MMWHSFTGIPIISIGSISVGSPLITRQSFFSSGSLEGVLVIQPCSIRYQWLLEVLLRGCGCTWSPFVCGEACLSREVHVFVRELGKSVLIGGDVREFEPGFVEDVTQVPKGSRLLLSEVEWEFSELRIEFLSLIDDGRAFLGYSAGVQVVNKRVHFRVPSVMEFQVSSGVRILIGIRGIHVLFRKSYFGPGYQCSQISGKDESGGNAKRLLELISTE
ncbi:hypothetical protein TNIN_487881 [Trichonephila inaurata madagascariensis]|uniref:Uncharacterized protein n=1 Tax=Trichonephila inaurata madagascariensis TaxID=2747483 RepID=A0A8X6XTF8_9ARAC|nr:hypothetical protein TNIN_200551 [Trichonephila inaurata madagascariensis]GFY58452.1 hypothetical protein TNIN_487881 [Trichonephila inaurata madagascariensis]